MKLHEIENEIRQGREFRHRDWIRGYYCHINGPAPIITMDKLFSNDWELKPIEVTITREKLAEAWRKTVDDPLADHRSFRMLCKELGL